MMIHSSYDIIIQVSYDISNWHEAELDHNMVDFLLSSHNQHPITYQSGTKPNLVAKILATKFGVFFVIYI